MSKEPVIPSLSLSKQYLKYSNFESKILPTDAVTKIVDEADVQVGIAVRATNFHEDTYEVCIDILANTYSPNGRELFVLDITYAGVFILKDVEPEELEMILLIYCPGIIYPFARRIVYTMAVEGGFPPLMLDLVDFSKIYYEQREKRDKEIYSSKKNLKIK